MKKIVFLFIVMLAVSPMMTMAMTAGEIAESSYIAAYYGGDDGRATVHMTIVDSQGQESNREYVILRLDKKDGGGQFYYMLFRSPSEFRRLGFIVNKNVSGYDDRWVYFPAMDLVKRIAPSDKRTSFVGSDFFHEDVSGRNVDLDNQTLMEDKGEYCTIKSVPKSPQEVEFSYYLTTIDKETFLPMKVEYFDRHGKKYRVIKTLEIKVIQGIPTAIVIEVHDLKNGGSTRVEFSEVRYDIDLRENIFTERYLRQPPKEVRR